MGGVPYNEEVHMDPLTLLVVSAVYLFSQLNVMLALRLANKHGTTQ